MIILHLSCPYLPICFPSMIALYNFPIVLNDLLRYLHTFFLHDYSAIPSYMIPCMFPYTFRLHGFLILFPYTSFIHNMISPHNMLTSIPLHGSIVCFLSIISIFDVPEQLSCTIFLYDFLTFLYQFSKQLPYIFSLYNSSV